MTDKFVVREEVDFIALAPVVLGFTPTRSLVMMTVDSFHARIDLPEEKDVDQCVDALLNPAVRHSVAGVAFVIYDEDDHYTLKETLVRRFKTAGINVYAAMEVRENKYRQFYGEWHTLDLSHHPLTLDAAYMDRAPRYATREELEAYVQPVGAEVSDEVNLAVVNLAMLGCSAVIDSVTRDHAREQVPLWTEALRGCQPRSSAVSDVAVILALCAWLAGDGALAWVALDQVDKESNWYLLLHTALDQAVSPAMWDEMR